MSMTRRHRLKLQVAAMLLLSFYSWELACANSTTENNINSHGTTGKDGECVASETACHQTPTEVASQQEEENDANSSKTSLEYYLRQRFASHPDALDSIRQKLRDGKLVVIHNAFPQAMADAAWADLNAIPDSHWPLHQNCETSGFCFAHHNIYDASQFTATMNDTLQVFDQPASQNFMADLSGRNCYGSPAPGANPPGTASYYMPGDHSLPHTDHISYRTVAYVWHLSKDWRPEWGGALYWAASCDETEPDRYRHASYNTLVLFSVTTQSSHFVTTVSPYAQGKRLSFNGWYTSSWRPSVEDDLEDRLATREQRLRLSDREFQDIRAIITDHGNGIPTDRRNELRRLFDLAQNDHFPPGQGGYYY